MCAWHKPSSIINGDIYKQNFFFFKKVEKYAGIFFSALDIKILLIRTQSI